MNNARQAVFSLLALVLCLALFEWIPMDLWLQRLFFDGDNQRWMWSSAEPISRFVLYDGLKGLLVVFALGLIASLFFCKRSPVISRYSRNIRIVILSLMLIPLSVSGLKAASNVACPRALLEFGGKLPYEGVFGDAPATRQRCFPAGHASGGFALMSLFFLFKTAKNQRRALYLAVATGWIMGGYKMLLGDHFLSHTIVTMVLAWLIINVVVMVEARLVGDQVYEAESCPLLGEQAKSADCSAAS